MREVALTVSMVFNDDGSVAMGGKVDGMHVTDGDKLAMHATAQQRNDVPRIAGKWLDKILMAKSKEIEQHLANQQEALKKQKDALGRMRK